MLVLNKAPNENDLSWQLNRCSNNLFGMEHRIFLYPDLGIHVKTRLQDRILHQNNLWKICSL